MSLSLISQPNQFHPAYNPIVIAVQSNETLAPGFRFIYKIYTGGSLDPFATFKVAALPNSAGGYLDISKVIQNRIDNVAVQDYEQLTPVDLKSGQNHLVYWLYVSYEYSYYWYFEDYQFAGYWVKLISYIEPKYKKGDLIEVRMDEVYGDNRDLLNGFFTVTENPTLSGGVWSLQISIPFDDIGSGPLSPGKTYFSDRRKLQDMVPPLPYPDEPLYVGLFIAYNGAIPFKNFPEWQQYKVLPTMDEEPQGDILTNSPNYLESFYTNDKIDKYIIKPYQQLYWNAFNYTQNDIEGQPVANTVIARNNLGDRWMLTDLENWDTATFMWQFDLRLDNTEWINITPNFTNSGGVQYGQNPYTHINPDGTFTKADWIDFWTTYQPGYESCDLVQLQVTINRIALPPIINDYEFRPYGQGFNGRRIYKGKIEGIDCILYYNGISQWVINAVNLGSGYQSIPALTSNTSFGVASASSNNADAYKVFDRVETTYYESAQGTGTCTITYEFPVSFFSNTSVLQYQLNKGYNPSGTNLPTQWRVRGSNDGISWTVLHFVSGNTSQGYYNSPYIYNGNRYKYIQLNIEAVFTGTEVRIWDFLVTDASTKAMMSSSNNCPSSGGFLYWTYDPNGTPNSAVPITSIDLQTDAIGDDTFPTLKSRRLFLDYDCDINTVQIMFLDRQGSYSSIMFPLRKIERVTNDKLSYKNEIGSVGAGGWSYNTYDSETTIYSSSIERTYTLTTDWINQGTSDYIEELITSPQVFVKLNSELDSSIDGDGNPTPWLSCSVIDTDFVNPKQKNKRLINRTITIKLNSNDSINI